MTCAQNGEGVGNSATSQRQSDELTGHVCGRQNAAHDLQVTNRLPDRYPELVCEHDACKWSPGTKPFVGQHDEIDVLREDHSSEFVGTLQNLLIGATVGTIFKRRENINTFPSHALDDRGVDVMVGLQSERHRRCPVRSFAKRTVFSRRLQISSARFQLSSI